ncbi:cell division cycle-associated protein 7 [Neodiprion pinetum]|uniref:cell division cycle-associated protein 7 n=1 Tax=Neodiprion pinetum TaxID=441929 RepID=UPI001EE067C4|nr:cell division cycle-associated protein 7-like [Neodiprion pinetum]
MEEDDYDAIRQKNIAERDAFFAEFFKDLKKDTADLKLLDTSRRRNLEDSDDGEEIDEPPKKRRKPNAKRTERWGRGKVKLEFRKKYNTRNSAKKHISCSNSDDTDEVEDIDKKRKGPRLKVLFPWAIPFEREISLMRLDLYGEENEEKDEESFTPTSEDEEEDVPKKRVFHKVLKSEYDPDSIPSPDEITEEQLFNIADRSSGKTYCKVNGTSCHQCRQKTLDTKTVCRSGECIGVRGQFCGPCLRGRYGEDAAVALKDPNWVCPPCRGLCNCSICRTRNGQRPTGILAPVVQEEGFSSVMDYLESAKTEEF